MTNELVPFVSKSDDVEFAIVLNDDDAKKLNSVVSEFNMDGMGGFTFGYSIQEKFKTTLMELIKGVDVQEIGGAGDLALEIAGGIKLMDLPKLQKEAQNGPPWWSKLPIIGKYASAFYTFVQRRKKLEDLIVGIEHTAREQMDSIMESNNRLDLLIEATAKNYHELGIYIGAGEQILLHESEIHEELRRTAIATNDPIQISQVNIHREKIQALDSRLLRLKTAYVRAPISSQEILIAQQAGRTEIQTIMDSLLADLPELISSLGLVASLQRTNQAQRGREKREKAARQLRNVTGSLLDSTVDSSIASQNRVVEEVTELAKFADRIIATTNRRVSAELEISKKRGEAEKILKDIHQRFSDALREAKQPQKIS